MPRVRTGLCTDERFRAHRAPREHPERPERLVAIERALAAAGLPPRCQRVAARPATRAELERVHAPEYLDLLERTVGGGGSGWLDPDTFYSEGSWTAALLAAGASVDLALAVAAGALDNGFALVRPPGHHATRDRAMGFCLLNNVAVAAAALRQQQKRVAIFDWDVHHGNGTEAIFDEEPDVLYCSTHEWPQYPGTGLADYVGTGRGVGATVNVPLPRGTRPDAYLAALSRAHQAGDRRVPARRHPRVRRLRRARRRSARRPQARRRHLRDADPRHARPVPARRRGARGRLRPGRARLLFAAGGRNAPGRPVTQPLVAGERYGDYELIRYLTAGGMADLWLAKSPRFADADLVVKKIQPRYIEMTRVVQMFIDEGRIAQALDHPNIVKVVDVGHDNGTYFIAMEYIPGRDLLAICRRGVEVGNFLPRHLAVAILAQAARGLVYAHEKSDDDGTPLRVVHCDISPGNIVVGWGGTVKLVDFGIARATIMLRESDHSVAGKYNYMAPEQIRGEPVDARADLFALGTILYELTVGKRLFRGRPEQVIRMVLDEPIVPPTELRPDFPASLEQIILRALERDPARRYQSARQLRTDLMAWLAETGLSHDKRRIAEYLRSIFNLKKQRDADEFAGDGAADDEELVLEKALPRPELELEVDPEDPPDEVHLVAPPAAGEVHPIMENSTAPIETKPATPADAGEPAPPPVPVAIDGTPPSGANAVFDEETAKKQRISLAEVRRLEDPVLEPERLPEPPTVRMRGDQTPKRILVPPVHRRRTWWRRFVSLFRRR